MSVKPAGVSLTRQPASRQEQGVLRLLDPAELPHILRLQDQVVRSLPDASLYCPHTADELEHMLGGGGLAVGVWADDELIAFHTALAPRDSAENLGTDLHIEAHRLSEVLHLEAACVRPDYRGNGLQRLMGAAIIAHCGEAGYRFLAETVAPDNTPSIRSTLANGLRIVKLAAKYGSIRYIFWRDLGLPFTWEPAQERRAARRDLAGQKELFGQGYCGVRLEAVDSQEYLILVRA